MTFPGDSGLTFSRHLDWCLVYAGNWSLLTDSTSIVYFGKKGRNESD